MAGADQEREGGGPFTFFIAPLTHPDLANIVDNSAR